MLPSGIKSHLAIRSTAKNIFFVLVCFFLAFQRQDVLYAKDASNNIRVSVLNNVEEIELSVRGGYKILRIDTGAVIDRGSTFFNRKVIPFSKGIIMADKNFYTQAIHIIPETQPAIYLDKRLYRGSLQIINTKKGGLIAVNIVDIEEYLKGVLYHEVSHRWPIETIKAQAIASRTYALYQAQENRNRHYHLYSDISSQVYNGVYAERYRTNKAVDETRGRVLMYNNKLIPAFFHSTCGSHTESAGNLWKIDIAPLYGVACPYCKNSPYLLWDYNIELNLLEKKLKSAGYIIDSINSIKALTRNLSGRMEFVQVKGSKLIENLRAKDFRNIIGSSLIRSTNFNVSIKDNKAYFKGKGWGHGVGMCQWGAFNMGKKKKTAEEILLYYYPGSKVAKS
jgi:stage II sporulation protein D